MSVVLIVDDSPTELHWFQNRREQNGFGTLVADIGWQRRWQMFGTYYDLLAEKCSDKVVAKWQGRLGGVESFSGPNCKKMAFSLWLD